LPMSEGFMRSLHAQPHKSGSRSSGNDGLHSLDLSSVIQKSLRDKISAPSGGANLVVPFHHIGSGTLKKNP
jgi:hypothetical protein